MNKKISEIAEKEFERIDGEQKNEKPKSLGNVNEIRPEPNTEFSRGFIEIYTENFPTRGLFYPKNWRFFIKSASTKDIRHWSTMDETNPKSIDDGLNEILSNCLEIREGETKRKIYKDLKEEDRFYVILLIKELTFPKAENQIVTETVCSCGETQKIELKTDNLVFKKLEDRILERYDENLRKIVFRTKSGDTFYIQSPSIGLVNAITKWARKKSELKKKLDESFLSIAMYLFDDWREITDAVLDSAEIEWKGQDINKTQFWLSLPKMVQTGVDSKLKSECEKCGGEVTADVEFPNGIKSLFIISNIFDQLL